ncbi:uncharacterized protein TRAVEDRAFT_43427 [Trametes versicolor FP-101664 SS1]|uniref:uncharacterized protein n=1 Tax=Trametes versicolor (strain FP-101664) TaxID=717944 RepID=UPI00046247FA|nr:uncharacterized protein TRAVEDRAFT_43427 [Trametes versicolor FP-101664 SS1]EIW63122.1 hypothetical protein TRAVEDRAFT_43427 [Trametes versicolor FP-101664 SS1]
MRPAILLSCLLCVVSVSAQHPSEGWQPEQQQQPLHVPPPAQTFNPIAEEPAPTGPQLQPPPPASGDLVSMFKSFTSLLGLNRLLDADGPVASLFGKMGVNVAEAIAPSTVSSWDLRIPLITDDNFDEIIVHEELTPKEEAARVWFLVISVAAGQNSAISKLVDHVTFLTTKWCIWSGPYLVVITDRGQTLRFYKGDRVRVTAELLRGLLIDEHWRNTPPWKTDFAPGGNREWVMHYYALWTMHISNFVQRFPRWTLLIGCGVIAKLAGRVLRRAPASASASTKDDQPQPPADQGSSESTTESNCATATSRSCAGSTATSTATSSPSKGAISRGSPAKTLRKEK